MKRLNRLISPIARHLAPYKLEEVDEDNRFTGETTGKILKLLGEVILNPNKKFYMFGENHKMKEHNMNTMKGVVEMLGLQLIEFRMIDFSIVYNLYLEYENEYDLYLKAKEGL